MKTTTTMARRPLTFAMLGLLLGSLLPGSLHAQTTGDQATLQLTLPPRIYAVPGIEMSVYFDNTVLTKTPERYRFEVKCGLGTTHQRRWSVKPTVADVGRHEFKMDVRNSDGRLLASASSNLQVTRANAGAGRAIRLLIVGDSLTHATVYPNEVARLLSQPDNPRWQMLGTHHVKTAKPGVLHEGYGGWTWQRFATKYEPQPDGTYRKRSSPFVYLGQDGKPQLDVPRYLETECGGKTPDLVIFMLGINDCFSAPADNLKKIDERIDVVFKHADKLLEAFRKAAPKAELGICLTTPPNDREAAFKANYQDRYTRWGWKRIQHRLVQRQIRDFADKEQMRLFIVPTQLNLDPLDGYPNNNGVHPNTLGYNQIAASIYAWIKSRQATID